MSQLLPLHTLFERDAPEVVELLLEVCGQFPGIVFAIAADGRIVFSGGRDLQPLPFDPRETVGRDYREVLSRYPDPLADIHRALEGEEFEVRREFLGRFHATRYAAVRDGKRLLGTIGITRDITNERRIEEELQTSQTLYRTVIETTDTGFVMLDQNGLVVDANDEYLRMTGYTALSEIQGRPVTEWTAPHDLERNAEEVEKCLRFGITRNLRIDYLDTHGRIVPIEINATYVYVAGQPRILALIRDVGDRLRAESDRVRQVRVAEAVLASVPDAMVVLDSTGTIQAVNAAWREFVAQFSFAQDIPVGPGGDYFEIFRRAAAEGARIQQECALGLRDVLAGRKDRHAMEFSVDQKGARRWYLKRSTRLLQEGGKIVVTHVDVTDRRAQQEAAERNARSWHTLLELVPVGVFQTDARGDCVYVNTTLCRLAGFTAEGALGEGWAAALHPGDRAHVFEEWYRAIAGGRPFELEYRLRRPDGQITWVRSEAVPVPDPEGRVTGYLATVRDITERKLRELARGRPEEALPRGAAAPVALGDSNARPVEPTWAAVLAEAWDGPGPASTVRLAVDRSPTSGAPGVEHDWMVRLASALLRRGDRLGTAAEGIWIVLPGSDVEAAHACAVRLHAAASKAAAPHAISVGVATRGAEDAGPVDLAIAADAALAVARKRGGDVVVRGGSAGGETRG